MNQETEDVEKLRDAYDLWYETQGGGAEHWLSLMADEVRIHPAPDGAEWMDFSRKRHGKSEAGRYSLDPRTDWEMIFFNADEFIAQGDRVVMLGRCAYRHRGTGKTAESAKADVFRFRDGKICEVVEFFDAARAIAAARPD